MNYIHFQSFNMAGDSTFEDLANERNKENRNCSTYQKFKRPFEVASIVCSTIGINILIACFLGASDALGIQSPEIIFKSVLGFLLVSTVLGVLAMVSSICKDGILHIFSKEFLFIRILKTPFCMRYKRSLNNQEELNLKDPVPKIRKIALEKPEEGKKFEATSENSSDVENKIKDGDLSTEAVARNKTLSLFKIRPSEASTPMPLRKRRTPLLLGECSVTQNSSHITKSSKFILFDLDESDERERLVPMIEETFMTERNTDKHFTENLHLREFNARKPQIGIVNPYQTQNSDFQGQFSHKGLDSTKENLNFSPKFNQKNKLSQKILHGNQPMIRNANMEDESPFKFQKRVSFQNSPNDKKDDSKFSSKMFNHKTTAQVSPSRQNILRNSRIEDEYHFDLQRCSYENPLNAKNMFSEKLQTKQQLQKVSSVLCDEKCYSSQENLGLFTETFQGTSKNPKGIQWHRSHPMLRKIPDEFEMPLKGFHGSFASFMEASKSPLQFSKETFLCNPKRVIPAHGMQKMDFEECDLQDKPVSPMEVCENLQSDKVFEVASKLNEMNFWF